MTDWDWDTIGGRPSDRPPMVVYLTPWSPLLSLDIIDGVSATSLLMGTEETTVPVVTLMGGIANEMIQGAMENSTDKSIYVNDAQVITPEIMTCESTVAHTIDTVILPPIILSYEKVS